MQYKVEEKNEKAYVHITPSDPPLGSTQDALDLVSLCAQYGTTRLLIDAQALCEDFFRLRTRIAGEMLQKLAQYGITTAIVMDPKRARGKFQDFLAESNRGKTFRAFADPEAAQSWLLAA